MKKAAAVVVALAILIAGLPALLGVLAQNRIGELANEATGQFLEVSISGYQRGWRTSRASLTVALSDSHKAMLEAPFPMGPGCGLSRGLRTCLTLSCSWPRTISMAAVTGLEWGLGLAHAVGRWTRYRGRRNNCLPCWHAKLRGVAARVRHGAFRGFTGDFPP